MMTPQDKKKNLFDNIPPKYLYLQGFKAKHILGNKIIHEQTLFRLVFNQHISVKLVKKESNRGTASALHHAKIYLSETNSD